MARFQLAQDEHSNTHYSVPQLFRLDPMLPLRHGEVVEKKLLLDLVLATGRELKMHWWREPKERMAVFLGIMLEGLILRRVGSDKTEEDEELVSLMGWVDLGIIGDAEVMEELEVILEWSLTINR